MTMVTRRPHAAPAPPDAAPAPRALTARLRPREITARLRPREITARLRPRGLWVVASLVLLAVVVVGATLGRSAWQAQQAAGARAAALAAGRQIAVDFVTMRAATFDADTRRVLDAATGSFRTEYAGALKQLKPVVTANHTVSTVERAEAALVTADDDSARVIVGVVAPTTNTSTPKPTKKTYRLRLDLVRVGDSWKVSSLDFVG